MLKHISYYVFFINNNDLQSIMLDKKIQKISGHYKIFIKSKKHNYIINNWGIL